MKDKLTKAFRYVTREGFQYAVDQFKRYYPWLQKKKEEANIVVEKVKGEAVPAVSKATDDMSKFVMKKYKEAQKLSKKAEKKRKKQKMNSIRNTIIATTLGFSAGAATGYVLVKKSQIKESDYVFKDDGVIENTNFPEVEKADTQQYTDFNDKYKISEDGTTLIRK